MRYNLKGTNLDLSAEVRAYVERKLNGLDELMRDADAARTDVELEYLESEEKQYRAELMLHDGQVSRAEARGGTLHEAIDKASQELFEQLTREKKRQRGAFRRSAVRVKEYLRGWRKSV